MCVLELKENEVELYKVQISERWDYEVEANSEAEAKQQATELREVGLGQWANPHAKAVYDLGTKVIKIQKEVTDAR